MPPASGAVDGLIARVRGRLAKHVARGRSVCVALSGGLDSTVLLDVLARLRDECGFALAALHVHHGLSRNADRWAEACAELAMARGVDLRVARVDVDRGHRAGLEAAARAARHAAFERAGADFLALAHHRDDQAETVLLQALRGTGLRGLAAMPAARSVGGVVWLRPFLDEARETLAAYARDERIAWVEDESNEQVAFDRNFLRHEVMPLLASRFPQCRESLARLARHAAGAGGLLELLARDDAARLADGEGLRASELAVLDPARRANLLRHVLAAHGLPMPGEARLAEMARQVVSAREDARVLLLHGGRALVRHRGRVVVAEAPGATGGWAVAWCGERFLALGGNRGGVRFGESRGQGIALARVAAGRWHFGPRAGGERIRPHPGRPTRTLKNLLQEHAVPAWRRGALPLLFDGERLVWVPGIGVEADYRPGPEADGLVPEWMPLEKGSEPVSRK